VGESRVQRKTRLMLIDIRGNGRFPCLIFIGISRDSGIVGIIFSILLRLNLDISSRSLLLSFFNPPSLCSLSLSLSLSLSVSLRRDAALSVRPLTINKRSSIKYRDKVSRCARGCIGMSGDSPIAARDGTINASRDRLLAASLVSASVAARKLLAPA